MIDSISLWLRRLRSLPVYARSFRNHARQNGMAAAVVKTYQYLRWGSGYGYGQGFRRWFSRHGLAEPVAPGLQAFDTPSVLIVGPLDLPQCRKYRVVQKLELLHDLGVDCHMSHVEDAVRVYNFMQLATHLVFYRVVASPVVDDYLAEARRLGLKVAYDIDDPVFDRETYRANRNLETLHHDEREHLLESADRHLAVMRQCDLLMVSTTAMADLVRARLHREAWVWPNVVDAESSLLAAQFQGGPLPAEENTVVAYMSGSRAHDRDFEILAPLLAELLSTHANMSLMLVGYVQVPDALSAFPDRLQRVPFGNYYEYFAALSRAQIVLVPLLIDAFNECKSAIRYFEASLLALPTIASRVGQFREVIEHEETGFLADTEAEWRESLSALLGDADLRHRIGRAAKASVLDRHSVASLPRQLSGLFGAFELEYSADE